MNNLSHKIIPIAITILTLAAFFNSPAYAGKGGTSTDQCRGPDCETTDPVDTTEPVSVNLSWTAPTTREDGEILELSELEGYRIYYGTDSNNLIPLVDLNDSSITTHSITDLITGTYYFAVTAYDYGGLESGFSEVVSKELL